MADLSTKPLLPQNKPSFINIAARSIELVLLSAGLVYLILIFKRAVLSTSSFDFLSIFWTWKLSSSLYICIFIQFIVILIAVSSRFQHPQMENNTEMEDGVGGDISHEDYDLLTEVSPSLSPPPLQINQNKHLPRRKPKDIAVAVAAAATENDHTRGKITKNQHTEEITWSDESHQQAVYSDLARLTKARKIRRAQTTNAARKFRTTEQDSRDKTAAKTAHDHYFQESFTDFPVKSFPIPDEDETTNDYGQTRGHRMNNNQIKEQLENDEYYYGDDDDSMDATWRAIMQRSKPQEKQLQKSETWPKAEPLINVAEKSRETLPSSSSSSSGSAEVEKELRKSLTFNDTVTITRRGGLRRDPSMNLEELNQRVESFIQNFNHEIRLQRQESYQRYLDMISRGL